MTKQDTTDKTLHDLLSGSHPQTKKYAGKQVFVINTEIIPVKQTKKSLDDFKKLKIKYGKPPILIFVPQPEASYILIFQ